jgi:hypothetical protein
LHIKNLIFSFNGKISSKKHFKTFSTLIRNIKSAGCFTFIFFVFPLGLNGISLEKTFNRLKPESACTEISYNILSAFDSARATDYIYRVFSEHFPDKKRNFNNTQD